jgi:hypothetical protein
LKKKLHIALLGQRYCCIFGQWLSSAGEHPAVDLKSKETVSCCAILVGCIKISAHPVAD